MITKKEYSYVVNVVFFKESPYIAWNYMQTIKRFVLC